MRFERAGLHNSIAHFRTGFSSRKDVLVTYMIIWFLISAPMLILISGISIKQMVYPLCLLMVAITIWIGLTIKKISSNVFNFYSLFILSALFFNGGQVFLEVFRLNDRGLLYGNFDSTILSLTLYLVILSLASFHAGGLLGARGKRKRTKDAGSNNYSRVISAQAIRIVGYGLLALSIVPILITTIKALMIVIDSGYFALYEQERYTGITEEFGSILSIFSRVFIPALLFLYAGSKQQYVVKMLITVAFLIYVGALFFMGSRGYGTMLLLSGLWVRHRLDKPLPLKQLFIIGVFLLFVIFPTVKHVRNIEGSSRYSLKSFTDAYLSIESPAVSIISEMGGSMQTIAYTMQLIPDRRAFAMGSTYAFVASSVIPNFFWDLHPAVKYGSLSRWLTMTVAPWTFHRGGGLGYSFIAEAYANFGWIGTPIVLGLIGFLSARLVRWSANSEDCARIAVVAVCIATALIWVRGDANIIVRPLFYYAFIPYAAFRFIQSRLHRMVKTKTLVRPIGDMITSPYR